MHYKKEIVGDSLSKGFSPFRLHSTIKVWNQKRDKINGLICSPKIFNIMNRLCINKHTNIWYYINIIILFKYIIFLSLFMELNTRRRFDCLLQKCQDL